MTAHDAVPDSGRLCALRTLRGCAGGGSPRKWALTRDPEPCFDEGDRSRLLASVVRNGSRSRPCPWCSCRSQFADEPGQSHGECLPFGRGEGVDDLLVLSGIQVAQLNGGTAAAGCQPYAEYPPVVGVRGALQPTPLGQAGEMAADCALVSNQPPGEVALGDRPCVEQLMEYQQLGELELVSGGGQGFGLVQGEQPDQVHQLLRNIMSLHGATVSARVLLRRLQRATKGTVVASTAWIGASGSLLFVGYLVSHPARDPSSVHDSPYATIHTIGALGMTFMAVGLVSLATQVQQRVTRTGKIAYLTAFTGTVLWVGLLFFDAFVNPILAQYAPEFVHSDAGTARQMSLFGPAMMLVYAALVLFVAGYAGFALTLRSNRLAPWPAALLLGIGAVVFGGGPLVPLLVEQTGGVLFALGFVWVMIGPRRGGSVDGAGATVASAWAR